MSRQSDPEGDGLWVIFIADSKLINSYTVKGLCLFSPLRLKKNSFTMLYVYAYKVSNACYVLSCSSLILSDLFKPTVVLLIL